MEWAYFRPDPSRWTVPLKSHCNSTIEFSLCSGGYSICWVGGVDGLYIQVSIEYQSVWSLRPNWFPPPPLPQASVSPPGAKGGHTRLRVRGRGSQFGRLERKPGTLSILQLVVYPFHLSLVCSDVDFKYVVYWAKWEGCIILTPFVYLYSIERFLSCRRFCVPFENRTFSRL
jgi:hypothetical protein